jgi:hypothetical protein
MNNTQKTLLAVYLPLTLLLLIFDHLYPAADMVQYLRYTVMITLFLSVTSMSKKYQEQRIMAIAFFFVVIADFFLVFSTTWHLSIDLSPLGGMGFLLAYLCLIAAYQRNFRIGWPEVLSAIPIALIFFWVFLILKPYVQGPMLIGALLFGIVLCYMTWTAVSTVYRGYYSPKIARLLALSGSLMFISDMGVAISMFHPDYAGVFVPWLKNFVWATYVPGWTLLALVISD